MRYEPAEGASMWTSLKIRSSAAPWIPIRCKTPRPRSRSLHRRIPSATSRERAILGTVVRIVTGYNPELSIECSRLAPSGYRQLMTEIPWHAQ